MYSKDYYLKHREELIKKNTLYYYKIKNNPNLKKRTKNYDKLYYIKIKQPNKKINFNIEFEGPCIISFKWII